MTVKVTRTMQGAPIYLPGFPGTFEYGVVYEVKEKDAEALKATGAFIEVTTTEIGKVMPEPESEKKVTKLEFPHQPEELPLPPETARMEKTGANVRVKIKGGEK